LILYRSSSCDPIIPSIYGFSKDSRYASFTIR
jgi:hypothetical protein